MVEIEVERAEEEDDLESSLQLPSVLPIPDKILYELHKDNMILVQYKGQFLLFFKYTEGVEETSPTSPSHSQTFATSAPGTLAFRQCGHLEGAPSSREPTGCFWGMGCLVWPILSWYCR